MLKLAKKMAEHLDWTIDCGFYVFVKSVERFTLYDSVMHQRIKTVKYLDDQFHVEESQVGRKARIADNWLEKSATLRAKGVCNAVCLAVLFEAEVEDLFFLPALKRCYSSCLF